LQPSALIGRRHDGRVVESEFIEPKKLNQGLSKCSAASFGGPPCWLRCMVRGGAGSDSPGTLVTGKLKENHGRRLQERKKKTQGRRVKLET